VTGLDFDHLAAQVQEVWLPRTDEMQLVTFALMPRASTITPGVARVRFTLFHQDNVVQSFLMAALLEGATEATASLLSTALGTPEKTIPADVGYLMRLEYSATDIAQVAKVPPRTLSIVANDASGLKVVTVKGKDFFSTTIDANLPNFVEAVREALRKASYNDIAQEYRFAADNSGQYSDLIGLLWPMAKTGWELFEKIFTDTTLADEVRALLGSEGIVHAAHMDLNQVIPWPLIYDLPIDEGRSDVTVEEGGVSKTYPVDRDVCPVGLPTYDGSFPTDKCGQSEACLLRGMDAQGQRRRSLPDGSIRYHLRETVVCPRHFWGFAHQIEVPVAQQQVRSSKRQSAVATAIAVAPLIDVAVGFNRNVPLADDHLTKLKAALVMAAVNEPVTHRRNDILSMLAKAQPDIVYFYCHAYVSQKDNPKGRPNLDFGAREPSDIVVSSDLSKGNKWERRPLVFLNACGSLGFSPAAPADFIATLVLGRGASGVVGTEVTVWPPLATETALCFLRAFLGESHSTAGRALVSVRRMLLSKNNPLGLVYTLYGSADLIIEAPKAPTAGP
jgi:hypothetical protein